MIHSVNEHFDGRAPIVREIYDTIVAAASEFGPVGQDPKKTSIHLNRKTAFAGIQTRRNFLILTIKATDDIPSPRITKREQNSPNRWHHEIEIRSLDEIDNEILGWLRDGYELSG